MKTDCLHPGGLAITQRLLALHPPRADSRLLDIGCGSGGSIAYIRDTYGCRAIGVDPQACGDGADIRRGAAEAIPFPGHSFDLALSECVLSLTRLYAALREIRRVLMPEGALLFSDIYARGEYALAAGLMRHMYTESQWLSALDACGFYPLTWEDISGELKAYLAQLIFERGAAAAYSACGLDRERAKSARPGYFLALARKTEEA